MGRGALVILGVLLSLSLLTISCSDGGSKPEPTAPHTGNPDLEEDGSDTFDNSDVEKEETEVGGDTTDNEESIPPIVDEEVEEDDEGDQIIEDSPQTIKLYVYTTKLFVRSSPEIRNDNILGSLYADRKHSVYIEADQNGDPVGYKVGGHLFVKILSFGPGISLSESDEYYCALKSSGGKFYLVTERVEPKRGNQYFMVQNVSSEIIRVYKYGCDSGSCPHKLILETDAVVGEEGETETRLGYYHITKWFKFYQDGKGLYPSWYHPSLPMPPKPGSGVMKWNSSKVMPNGGSARGAFGWYTAHVGPNSHFQWTHGTFGWGKDGKKFLEQTRGWLANVFADPRSHGCTRTDNESIAFIRSILSVGAPIIKVYAREGYGDVEKSRYSKESKVWEYILTSNDSRAVNGQVADRQKVSSDGTPRSQWLEEGVYAVDAYPDAQIFYTGEKRRKSGKSNNVYGLDHSELRGVFLVDEGRFVNYQHPARFHSLRGGYKKVILPPDMIAPSSKKFTHALCQLDREKYERYKAKKGPGRARAQLKSKPQSFLNDRCVKTYSKQGISIPVEPNL